MYNIYIIDLYDLKKKKEEEEENSTFSFLISIPNMVWIPRFLNSNDAIPDAYSHKLFAQVAYREAQKREQVHVEPKVEGGLTPFLSLSSTTMNSTNSPDAQNLQTQVMKICEHTEIVPSFDGDNELICGLKHERCEHVTRVCRTCGLGQVLPTTSKTRCKSCNSAKLDFFEVPIEFQEQEMRGRDWQGDPVAVSQGYETWNHNKNGIPVDQIEARLGSLEMDEILENCSTRCTKDDPIEDCQKCGGIGIDFEWVKGKRKPKYNYATLRNEKGVDSKKKMCDFIPKPRTKWSCKDDCEQNHKHVVYIQKRVRNFPPMDEQVGDCPKGPVAVSPEISTRLQRQYSHEERVPMFKKDYDKKVQQALSAGLAKKIQVKPCGMPSCTNPKEVIVNPLPSQDEWDEYHASKEKPRPFTKSEITGYRNSIGGEVTKTEWAQCPDKLRTLMMKFYALGKPETVKQEILRGPVEFDPFGFAPWEKQEIEKQRKGKFAKFDPDGRIIDASLEKVVRAMKGDYNKVLESYPSSLFVSNNNTMFLQLMKKIGIVGSSKASSEEYEKSINDILSKYDPKMTVIVSGGAKGVDSIAVKLAKEKGFEIKEFKPTIPKEKRSAENKFGWLSDSNGIGNRERNLQIANYCDKVYCVIDPIVKETKCYHCSNKNLDDNHEKTAGCYTALRCKQYELVKLEKKIYE